MLVHLGDSLLFAKFCSMVKDTKTILIPMSRIRVTCCSYCLLGVLRKREVKKTSNTNIIRLKLILFLCQDLRRILSNTITGIMVQIPRKRSQSSKSQKVNFILLASGKSFLKNTIWRIGKSWHGKGSWRPNVTERLQSSIEEESSTSIIGTERQ